MGLGSTQKSFSQFILLTLVSCSSNNEAQDSRTSALELNQNDQKSVLEDAAAESESSLLESFEVISEIENSLSDLVNQEESEVSIDNSSLIANKLLDDDPLVKIETSEEVSSEFSEPVMITGSYLNLRNSSVEQKCRGLNFEMDAPSMKTIFQSAQTSEVCGYITINICMRLSVTSVSESNRTYTYAELPAFTLPIPCKEESFVDAGFEAKPVSQGETSVDLLINAKEVVNQMKLFNAESCDEQKEWQDIKATVASFPINWSAEGSSPVSIIFRDRYGYESECISQVIQKPDLETDTIKETDPTCLADEVDLDAATTADDVVIEPVIGSAKSPPYCTTDSQPNDVLGSEDQPPSCNSIGTPGTWILVPGDPDYGTNDFCVMNVYISS